jgi:hypothetical protein
MDDAVPFQKRPLFFLKCFARVMLFLPSDVVAHG